MYEKWLKYAHPGFPRLVAWVLAWLTIPLIVPVAVLASLLIEGFSESGDILRILKEYIAWLYAQRTTFDLDPWSEA